METPRDRSPMYSCPRFQRCGAPVCALDPQMLDRGGSRPGEERCKATRRVRLEVAARFPSVRLPADGLTLDEVAKDARRAKAKAKWAAMTPEDRAARLAHLVPFKAKHAGTYPQHAL
jgi:hypothetical protein